MKKLKKLASSAKGFTLIELVMAIVILSIAIAPLLVVLPSLLFDSTVVEYVDIGAYLAEEEVERVLSLPFASVANAGPTAYTGNYADYSYQITTSAVPAALAANCATVAECKQVDIAISHADVGTLLTIQTYVADF